MRAYNSPCDDGHDYCENTMGSCGEICRVGNEGSQYDYFTDEMIDDACAIYNGHPPIT